MMFDMTIAETDIKVLFDDIKLDTQKCDMWILSSIISFLEKTADEIDMLDQEQGFLADQIDDVEEVIDVLAEEISDEYDDDADEYQIKCDNCGNNVHFTGDDIDDLVEGNFDCPYCGETVQLDLSGMEDGCDCGCSHDHSEE